MHRKAEPTRGPLARTIVAALEQWDAQKKAGASPEELAANLEKTLRAAWPRRREDSWKFLCERCLDTGFVESHCPEVPCGRPFRHPGQRSDDYTGQGKCVAPHSYVRPCLCMKGRSLADGIARSFDGSRRDSHDVESAGQRRKMTRVGER